MTQYSLGGLMGDKTAEEAKKEGKQLIDAGWYEMVLNAVEMGVPKQRPNAAPGVMNTTLKLTFTVQQMGKFQGWKHFKYIALDHGNDGFTRASRAFIGSLAVALGHMGRVSDLGPFMNKPVLGKITKSEDKNNPATGVTKEAENDLREFKNLAAASSIAPSQAATAPKFTPPAAAPAVSAPRQAPAPAPAPAPGAWAPPSAAAPVMSAPAANGGELAVAGAPWKD